MFKRNKLIKNLKIAEASFMFKIQFAETDWKSHQLNKLNARKSHGPTPRFCDYNITVETWVLDAFSLPLLHLASESRT